MGITSQQTSIGTHRTITAFALGAVQRLVGTPQQMLGRLAGAWRVGHAGAGEVGA